MTRIEYNEAADPDYVFHKVATRLKVNFNEFKKEAGLTVKDRTHSQKLTIEDVKKEYFRIEDKLNIVGLSQTAYDTNCNQGYSPHMIKKDLGLTYDKMKTAIGAKPASRKGWGNPKKPKKKIYCSRGDGGMILDIYCVVGCSPINCDPCPNKQLKNVKASSDTLTEEEERIARHQGVRGMGYSDMIAPYAEI
jgi:hypothetical protein